MLHAVVLGVHDLEHVPVDKLLLTNPHEPTSALQVDLHVEMEREEDVRRAKFVHIDTGCHCVDVGHDCALELEPSY